MKGEIDYRDPITNEKRWFTKAGKTRRKEMPDPLRHQFEGEQISCVEYYSITDEQEREIFHRVQNGVALRPAERLKAISGLRAELTREMLTRLINLKVPDSMKWDTTRGRDFQSAGSVLYLVEKQLDKTRKTAPQPTMKALHNWLYETTVMHPSLPSAVGLTFAILARLFEDPKDVRHMTPPKATKMSPLEFSMIGLLIHTHCLSMSLLQLTRAIRQMRDMMRSKFDAQSEASRAATFRVAVKFIQVELVKQPPTGDGEGSIPAASCINEPNIVRMHANPSPPAELLPVKPEREISSSSPLPAAPKVAPTRKASASTSKSKATASTSKSKASASKASSTSSKSASAKAKPTLASQSQTSTATASLSVSSRTLPIQIKAGSPAAFSNADTSCSTDPSPTTSLASLPAISASDVAVSAPAPKVRRKAPAKTKLKVDTQSVALPAVKGGEDSKPIKGTGRFKRLRVPDSDADDDGAESDSEGKKKVKLVAKRSASGSKPSPLRKSVSSPASKLPTTARTILLAAQHHQMADADRKDGKELANPENCAKGVASLGAAASTEINAMDTTLSPITPTSGGSLHTGQAAAEVDGGSKKSKPAGQRPTADVIKGMSMRSSGGSKAQSLKRTHSDMAAASSASPAEPTGPSIASTPPALGGPSQTAPPAVDAMEVDPPGSTVDALSRAKASTPVRAGSYDERPGSSRGAPSQRMMPIMDAKAKGRENSAHVAAGPCHAQTSHNPAPEMASLQPRASSFARIPPGGTASVWPQASQPTLVPHVLGEHLTYEQYNAMKRLSENPQLFEMISPAKVTRDEHLAERSNNSSAVRDPRLVGRSTAPSTNTSTNAHLKIHAPVSSSASDPAPPPPDAPYRNPPTPPWNSAAPPSAPSSMRHSHSDVQSSSRASTTDDRSSRYTSGYRDRERDRDRDRERDRDYYYESRHSHRNDDRGYYR
ncbi:hypothetical protein HGRIS_010678 [Hohenbuehelia grisea]|uniref:Uncharacterized protein n=1 Tax=Hohenbuehelia grisea TaxID=104357 RepID=A0ABR3IY62_9AGAR